MKNEERLRRAYNTQKKIFDDAQDRRTENLRKQLEIIENKLSVLLSKKAEIEERLKSQKSFEDFETFRQRAVEQSSKS